MTSLGLHGFLGYYIECSIASGGGASSPLKGHNATWQPLVELAIKFSFSWVLVKLEPKVGSVIFKKLILIISLI